MDGEGTRVGEGLWDLGEEGTRVGEWQRDMGGEGLRETGGEGTRVGEYMEGGCRRTHSNAHTIPAFSSKANTEAGLEHLHRGICNLRAGASEDVL